MKILLVLALIVFCFSLANAISADFNCPQSVNNNQEFECSLKVTNFSGIYDLKIDISQNGKRISKIWNNDWKSTNYYILNFITDENERTVRLIVNASQGDVSGILKLRPSGKDKIDYENNFSLNVILNPVEVDNVDETKEKLENLINNTKVTDNQTTNIPNQEEKPSNENIINLNSTLNNDIVYESKNEKIKQYSIYGFCIFLILIIILLIIWR